MRLKESISLIIILVTIAVALGGCTTGTTAPSATASPASGLKAGLADNPNYRIEIVGDNRTVTVTFADIKAMDFVELKGVVMVNSAGTEFTNDYVGVPMMDIIDRAGLPAGDYNYKVSASDGYVKVYTQAQMENALLGLKQNETALTDNINKDSIRMVMPGEPGDMWMKCPAKIELTQAAGSSSEPFVLNITGITANAIGLKLSKLQSYPVKSLAVPYKNNTTLEVSGPSLNKILDDYAKNATATTIRFVASDGFNKTLSYADVRADEDAIIAIDPSSGVLRVVIPSQAYSNWVSKLSTIELS